MELRMRLNVGFRRVVSSALFRAILPLGWLLPLVLLLVVTLLTAFPVASADAVAANPLASEALSVRAGLAVSQPQTLTLSALPAVIPANGLAFSVLTADVQDPQGDPVDDGTVVVFSTTLGTFPGALTITPQPSGVMTIEAESAAVVTTGLWMTYSEASASSGEVIYSNIVSATASCEFTGTAISVLFQKQSDAGIARVYVDDELYGTIDTFWEGPSPGKLYQQEVPIATGLPYASHVIKVEVTAGQNISATDHYLVVDAFRVYGHDRNGAALTSGGVVTITLTSVVTPGMAQVTACAVPACDTESITFSSGFVYLPIAFKNYPLALPEGCTDLILNGSFEDSTAWTLGVTSRPARYSTAQSQTGSRSVLVGLKPGEVDRLSYSSVRQAVVLPANTDTATLRFWYLPLSDLDAGDRQECLLLDKNDHMLAVLMRTNANTGSWVKMSYDISAYAGQTVNVYCNAYNDGDGNGVTGFYLDTVSVVACTSGEVPPETPEPPETPVPPTPQPLPPLGPLDCYPGLLSTVGVGSTPHGIGVNSAARRIYVANHGSNTLSVVDSTSYGVIASPAVGKAPNGVAYNAANDRIYVANGGGNSVTVLRASDYGLVKTLPVGSRPNGVAVNKVTNRVYVVNSGSGTVSIINGATNAVDKTVAVGPEPARVAIDPILNKAFVSLYGTDQVAIIDGAGNVTKASTFSGGAYGIAVDAVRHLVYVATIDTFRIAVIDGLGEAFLGWAEIRRMPSTDPVPLRMIDVNPLIGSSGHIFVTTAGEDGGWNRFLLLPKGWPEHFARPTALDLNEPREGIAFEPTTLRVFATSRSDGRVAVYLDGQPVCPATFSSWDNYQITVCVASPDGTCQQMVKH